MYSEGSGSAARQLDKLAYGNLSERSQVVGVPANSNHGPAIPQRGPTSVDLSSSRTALRWNLDWLVNAGIALVALVLIAPVLALAALAVKLESRGPVFFLQERRGLNGKVFRIVKLRTMSVMERGDQAVQCKVNDNRVTRIGRFLRKASIDELPQLFNVLSGSMRLVGPRPHPLSLDQNFRGKVPGYMNRYAVTPGLTGLAQIKGYRGPTDTVQAMTDRVALDLQYARTRSAWLDMGILLKTVPAILLGKNAH